MPDAHLLVVDDELHVSLVIEHACVADGYAVTTARTLAEARDRLRTGMKVDLLLLDVGLPDGSGFDLLTELRDDDATRELPVIVLTGAGYDHVVERTLNLGARCVTKPFSPSKLRRLVEEALAEARGEP